MEEDGTVRRSKEGGREGGEGTVKTGKTKEREGRGEGTVRRRGKMKG